MGNFAENLNLVKRVLPPPCILGLKTVTHLYLWHSSMLLRQTLQLSRNASTTNLMHVTAI